MTFRIYFLKYLELIPKYSYTNNNQYREEWIKWLFFKLEYFHVKR